MGYISDLLVFLVVLNVWAIVSEFAETVEASIGFTDQLDISEISLERENSNEISWEKIFSGYKSIRQLCQVVNKPFASIVLLYLTDTVIFLSTALDIIIIETEWQTRLRLGVFLVLQTTVFLVSADVSKQVI